MLGEIIAIGDQLMSGRILNTASSYAAGKLYDAGYTIQAMSTIGARPELISEALVRAITRVDFIIVTGGLGAADDDLTNESVCQALNRLASPDVEMRSRLRAPRFRAGAAADQPLAELTWLPAGAEAFKPDPTITGYQLNHEATPIFFLSGTPGQMKQLLSTDVLPRLAAWKAGSRLQSHRRIYKIFGVGQAELQQMITSLKLAKDIIIEYYPDFPDIQLSLLQRGAAGDVQLDRFEDACQKVAQVLGPASYGTEQDDLALVIGRLLAQQAVQLAVAESCTGGRISQRITSIAGSSNYFLGGAITYANRLKKTMLGVSPAELRQFGAVSAEVAESMARGLLTTTRADLSLSATGIAGPEGGSVDKPVGSVYLALADKDHCQVSAYTFSGQRTTIQRLTAHTALNLLRLYLLARS